MGLLIKTIVTLFITMIITIPVSTILEDCPNTQGLLGYVIVAQVITFSTLLFILIMRFIWGL